MTTKPDETATDTPPWAPDARWALPAVLAAWTWTLGWLPVWAERWGDPITPWLMLAFGVLTGVVGVWRARTVWPVKSHGDALREQGSLLAVVVGLVVGAWLVRAGFTSPWRATPLLLVGAGVCGAWFAALVSTAPRHRAEEAARAEALALRTDQEADRALLDESGCADVLVIDHKVTRAGYTVTLGPDPAYPQRPSYSTMLTRLPQLTTNLAIHWRARDATVLEERDVVLESVAADRWLLHVSTKHVLVERVVFHTNPHPLSFNAALLLGLYETGEPMEVNLLGQHMKIIGATGGGKSVIVNNIIARVLECRDGIGRPDGMVWLCGVEKVVPLVYPWLIPWLSGQRPRPAIDWVVGEDADDVRRFLLAVYDLVRGRNRRNRRRSKASASAEQPGIVVFIEEAKIAATKTEPIDMGDGELWTISRLLSEITALARSAAVSIVPVTQQGLYEGLGPYGTELMRNLTLRACTVTMTESDGRMSLPGLPGSVNTVQLRNHSMYLQLGIGQESRAMPGKAGDLDEERVPPIAYAVSDRLAHLSAADVEAIGADYYGARWDAASLPLLVEAAAEDAEAPGGQGFGWPSVGAPPLPDMPGDIPPHPEPPSVYTDPDEVSPDAYRWRPEWDVTLRGILGEPEEERGTGPYGLPGPEYIERLWEIARRMQAEAAAQEALPPGQIRPVPPPLNLVIAHLDTLDPRPEWISTKDLAAGVFGPEPDCTHRLGLALARITPELRSTEPQAPDGGKKRRGYVVAELYRIAAEISGNPG
jgi:hypothetical protein